MLINWLIVLFVLIKLVNSFKFNSTLDFKHKYSYENLIEDREFCSLPLSDEECDSPKTQYTYHPKLRKCIPYKSCTSARINFETDSECNEFCTTRLEINPNNKLICTLSIKEGPCRAYLERYYYDTKSNQCQTFHYGGCQGNLNNFEKLENCNKLCQNVTQIIKTNEDNLKDNLNNKTSI